jgi:hypothetical protein
LQAPQWAGSRVVSTHSELHSAKPRSQSTLQVPAAQLETPWAGSSQATPQAPQWLVSVRVSAHELPHGSKPSSQVTVQAPARQMPAPFSGMAQPALHSPQCAFDVARFTHAPLQLVVPLSHASEQMPFEHTLPTAQRSLHVPQCSGSLDVSTHASPHSENPASQRVPHTPWSQTAIPFGGVVQRAPQAPQFETSRPRSTQAPSHAS